MNLELMISVDFRGEGLQADVSGSEIKSLYANEPLGLGFLWGQGEEPASEKRHLSFLALNICTTLTSCGTGLCSSEANSKATS